MVEEGQLQKRIKQYTDQWVGVFYGRLSDEETKRWFNKKGRKMETDRDNIMTDVKQAIGEMRKEFPWKIHIDEDLDAIEIWKRLVLERDKWYVKWLGGDEEERRG